MLENLGEHRKYIPLPLQAGISDIQAEFYEGYQFALTQGAFIYKTSRNAEDVLVRRDGYSWIPNSIDNTSALNVVKNVTEGGYILDVGCGNANLAYDIQTQLNQSTHVFGFDAKQYPGQERLEQSINADIYSLSLKMFPDVQNGFNLVISSATVYRVIDRWGAILRMAHVLKPEGDLLSSTFPRVINKVSGTLLEDRANCR